jgi:hypothetical protein
MFWGLLQCSKVMMKLFARSKNDWFWLCTEKLLENDANDDLFSPNSIDCDKINMCQAKIDHKC